MGAPVVNPLTKFVILNQSILASTLFTASDPDSDPITQYRFTDLLSGGTTGFFKYNGVPIANGATTTVSAANLSKLSFSAGNALGTENVSIEVFANGQWSAAANALVYFVLANTTPPKAITSTPTVLQDEFISVSDFVSGTDPDGWPILNYFIRDNKAGVGSSYLVLNGTPLPQNTFRNITAADFANLQYFARNTGEQERIEVFVFDGAQWSAYNYAIANVTPNASAPVSFYADRGVRAGASNEIVSALGWNDADGNTIKWVEFYDTDSSASSGNLEQNGIALQSGKWHRVSFDNLDTMRYMGAPSQYDETIRYRVFDGRYVSAQSDYRLHSVEAPDLENKFLHETALTTIQGTKLIKKLDGGPSITMYEFTETNPSITSGFLRMGSTALAANQVHTVAASQLNQLNFRTARPEVRAIDEVYVRAWNGTFWSDWTNIEIRSESYYRHALKVLDNPLDLTSLEANTWLDYLPLVQPDPYLLTYSFSERWTTSYQPGDGATEDNYSSFTNAQRAMARSAFGIFSELTFMNFEEIPDTTANSFGQQGGIIRMSNYFNPDGEAAAFAYLPGFSSAPGDIWMNVAFTSTTPNGTVPGTSTFATFIHELGHAVGMKHPHDESPRLPASIDSSDLTVMSYIPGQSGQQANYMLYDILTLQDFYGTNYTTRADDTLYDIAGYFNGNDNVVATIWDGGGTDTFSIAGAQLDSTVDIRQGGYSSFGTVFNPFTGLTTLQPEHVAIAFKVDIENAIGSSNNDTIIGNHLNNTLNGGAGDDEIFGGAGNDLMLGLEGDDVFHSGVGQGNDVIDEQQKAGRDSIVLDSFPTLNSLSEDLSFRRLGRDLYVELALNNGEVESSIRIQNQLWGSYRIETLSLGGVNYDLNSIFTQVGNTSTRFAPTGSSSIFGELANPV